MLAYNNSVEDFYPLLYCFYDDNLGSSIKIIQIRQRREKNNISPKKKFHQKI